jgi:hypothetical protein
LISAGIPERKMRENMRNPKAGPRNSVDGKGWLKGIVDIETGQYMKFS